MVENFPRCPGNCENSQSGWWEQALFPALAMYCFLILGVASLLGLMYIPHHLHMPIWILLNFADSSRTSFCRTLGFSRSAALCQHPALQTSHWFPGVSALSPSLRGTARLHLGSQGLWLLKQEAGHSKVVCFLFPTGPCFFMMSGVLKTLILWVLSLSAFSPLIL